MSWNVLSSLLHIVPEPRSKPRPVLIPGLRNTLLLLHFCCDSMGSYWNTAVQTSQANIITKKSSLIGIKQSHQDNYISVCSYLCLMNVTTENQKNRMLFYPLHTKVMQGLSVIKTSHWILIISILVINQLYPNLRWVSVVFSIVETIWHRYGKLIICTIKCWWEVLCVLFVLKIWQHFY